MTIDAEKKIAYIHAYVGDGRVTAAFEMPPKDKRSEARQVNYAVAYCSPKDNFSRERGRLIAAGRLEKARQQDRQGDYKWVDLLGTVTVPAGGKLTEAVLESILFRIRREGPNWARNALRPPRDFYLKATDGE